MANGVLDYQRYLNTLQTLNDLGQTFPSNQQTYNFSVAGGTTASWTCTISWETLILDTVSYSSQATGYIPNVDSSQVIGYYEGSTSTQYSTGVISLPANMYTGPILPGGDYHVPLTVVHLQWFDGTTTYAQQIGFIQNWEPGVEIADPTLDFNYFPVYSIPSTLTLTGDTGIVYGDNLTLTATTDMTIDLGVNATRVRFYRESTGTNIVLGTAYFTGTVATLVVPTNPNLPIGNYNIYAVSQPRGIYRSATSNTLNVRVEAGVPLIVTTSTFTPSQAYYYPGHTVNYRLGVIADPAFTATGVAIANPIDIKLVNAFTPFTETNILSANFQNGQTTTNFTVQSSMIDVSRTYPQTQYSITTSTQNSTQYTATLFVSNTETVTSSWGYQTLGRYRAGSTSTTINVATSTSVTVTGQSFPLTITQSSTSTYFDESFSITVNTNTATYYTNISLIANNGSTSTTLYSGNNSGAGIFTVSNIIISTTGTWTITASYPGDLGISLVNANLPSTSNSLSHRVRLGNDLLPTPIVTTTSTVSGDTIKITANTSTTLTNTLTFKYDNDILGTGQWERYNIVTATTTTTVLWAGLTATMATLSGGFERNWDGVYGTPQMLIEPANGWSSESGPYWDSWYGGGAGYQSGRTSIPYSNTTAVKINSHRLFKYYDGSNYNLSAVTGTNYSEIADPITFGTTWNTDYKGTLSVNGNELFDYASIYSSILDFNGAYYKATDQVKVNIYDVYKTDLVGDTRGYNVVGLDAATYTGPTNVSEENPRRLYFRVNKYKSYVTGISYFPAKLRYIELVEYIGEVEWTVPYINQAQENGTQPRTKIKVKLFRFTPTIPQTRREFRTNFGNTGTLEAALPDPILTNKINTGTTFETNGLRIAEYSTTLNGGTFPQYQLTGEAIGWSTNTNVLKYSKFRGAGTRFAGSFQEWEDAGIRWSNYGVKVWQSTNPGNAEADDLADFYNEWYMTFSTGAAVYQNNNPHYWSGSSRRFAPNPTWVSFDPITSTSTSYTYTPTDIQFSILELPADTLPDETGVHVTWTGTLSLPIIYGRYNPFDIYSQPMYIVNPAEAYNVSIGSYISPNTSTQYLEYSATKVYPTNPVKLTATIDSVIPVNSGTMQFINVATGAVITSTNIVNGVGTASIYANNLTTATVATNATSGVPVFVKTKVVGRDDFSFSDLRLEAFNFSGFTYTSINSNFTVTNFNAYPCSTFTNTTEVWPKQGIATQVVKRFYSSYFTYPDYGAIILTGTLEIVAPYFVKGRDSYYKNGVFYPIYGDFSSLYITVSSGANYPGVAYKEAMLNPINANVPVAGPIDGVPAKQSGSGRYKIEQSSVQDSPNIVTLQFNNKVVWYDSQNPLAGANRFYTRPPTFTWDRLDIRVSIEAYDDDNNLVATIPANCLLGYKENLTLDWIIASNDLTPYY
jgi:hypothetical protein